MGLLWVLIELPSVKSLEQCLAHSKQHITVLNGVREGKETIRLLVVKSLGVYDEHGKVLSVFQGVVQESHGSEFPVEIVINSEYEVPPQTYSIRPWVRGCLGI